jgi:hypothetical protein
LLLAGAAALTPASANYGHCSEQPSMPDCRDYGQPSAETLRMKASAPRHAEIRRTATKQAYLNESVKKQSSTKGHESGARHARGHEAPSSRPASNAKS